MKEKELTIIGFGSHSKVISEIATLNGYKNIHFIENNYSNQFTIPQNNKKIKENFNGDFFVAIGDNNNRQRLYNLFINENPLANPVNLIHPNSVISNKVHLGRGIAAMALSVINISSRIGNGVILNTSCSIDHDSYIDDFASVAPGVNLGGNVKIGERSAIGIGATIKHGICIGKDTVVGASSLVLKDIGDNKVAYGSPASVKRLRQRGDSYL